MANLIRYGVLRDITGKLDEFHYYPLNNRYAVSRSGSAYDTELGKPLSPQIGAYVHYRLVDANGKQILTGRHRMVAITYIPDDRDITKLQVNHKDGNKWNDYVDNLEWTTPRENTLHAGATGLSDKCLPILARDAKSLEVKRYDTILECAEEFGIHHDSMKFRARSEGTRVFPEGFQYKLERCTRDWTPVELADHRYGRDIAVICRNLITGEEKRFDKQAQLAHFFKSLRCLYFPTYFR